MKLNKTLTLAALVLGGLLAGSFAACAQDSTNTPTAGTRPPGAARGRMNFESIATQLQLSEDQKTKARPIFQALAQQQAELRRDTTLSQADRRTKVLALRNDTTAKLKEILTPEQLDQWQKMTPGRRPAGGTTPPPPGGGQQ
jgi:Spy/CpxP family protein refolding chaperone